MDYINAKDLTVDEAKAGFDLNDDGDTDDTIELTIEYDENGHADTNGYYGSYLDFTWRNLSRASRIISTGFLTRRNTIIHINVNLSNR